MKNLFFCPFFALLLAFCGTGTAQISSSGIVSLETSVGTSVQFDVNATTSMVTMTLVGPSTRWFGVGLNVNRSAMVDGTDCIYVSEGVLVDALIEGVGRPTIDQSQNWTEVSNTIDNGVRTVVATRALNTGDSMDYVFPANPTSLGIIYAHGRTATSSAIGGHDGDENAGATTASFQTLGIDEVLASKFVMSPNPAKTTLAIEFPENVGNGAINIFDFTGKRVKSTSFNTFNTTIDIAGFPTGLYHVQFDTSIGSVAKKLIKI